MAHKPRAIFEEVGTTEKQTAVETGAIDRRSTGARGAIRVWLMVLFALVVAMIAIGGLTRLTDSGLSITEWRPVTGALPPMSATEWDAEFAKYQEVPQFVEVNADMTVEGFKRIYWWEWSHRQLGRVIGLVWAVGYLGFALTKNVPTGWHSRLLLLGALGGMQGAIGWWMVHSGLQDGMVSVASYRLAVHLGLAFAILSLIAWFALRLGRREKDLLQARRLAEPKLFSMSTGLLHLSLLQVLIGALVAGIDAGRAYPTWPMMGDSLLPPQAFALEPVWRNFFENAALVQFIHRCAGYLLAIFAVVVWARARRSANGATRAAFHGVLGAVAVQVVLGIVTLVNAAPLALAIAHQLTAVLLITLILRGRFLARYPLPQSVRG